MLGEGLEPSRLAAQISKTCAYTISPSEQTKVTILTKCPRWESNPQEALRLPVSETGVSAVPPLRHIWRRSYLAPVGRSTQSNKSNAESMFSSMRSTRFSVRDLRSWSRRSGEATVRAASTTMSRGSATVFTAALRSPNMRFVTFVVSAVCFERFGKEVSREGFEPPALILRVSCSTRLS